MSDNEQPPNIEDHPNYPDIIDKIEEYGNHSKKILVELNYDESGENLSKQDLNKMSKGQLLAMLIDGFFGGTCH